VLLVWCCVRLLLLCAGYVLKCCVLSGVAGCVDDMVMVLLTRC